MVGSADFQRQAGALQVMAFKSIAIGADHAGFALKAKLAEALKSAGNEVIAPGTRDGTPNDDYPDFGRAVAEAVTAGKAHAGLIVCGTAIGIPIARKRPPAGAG